MTPPRRTGFEVELTAPPGSDREVLARDLADRCGGSVRRVLATGSEPSAVPGMGSFWHLAPAFEVRGADGATRMLRACTDGPVLDASTVRWDCVGAHGASVPADAVGAPDGGAA